ncbi:hypothetical protein [Flavobacterium sp. LAR06]|uniref:hypothetical protein n=1 Tax=Flavobacterium sp. LAR06 TaxID=3064897 RepID=UPI0035BF6586
MRKVTLFMMSFIVLTFLSCSEETMKQNDETAVVKNTTSTKKIASEDCGTPTQFAVANDLYNCFGLAFSVSEGLGNEQLDNYVLYNRYIKDSIFKEDNSSKATKVIYWNNVTDYNNRNFVGVEHAAVISSGNTVYSKQGAGGALFRNCIDYYYIPGRVLYHRTYALNMDLNKPAVAPKRNETFTVSLKHFSSELPTIYTWDYDHDNLEQVSYQGTGFGITLKVKTNAVAKSYSVTLKATHQRGVIFNTTSLPKEITNLYSFSLASITPTASFTGSSYVTKTSMGSWTGTASGGTGSYTYSWWIKRQQDPDSFYLQIGTGSELYLLTKTSIKSTYYNLYLRVVDSNGQSFSTQPQVIQSTGVLEEAL